MNFALSLIIYLIFFVVFLWVFSKFGMGLFSALVLTALLSALVLLVLVPPSEIEDQIDIYFSNKPHHKTDDYIVLIYLLIMILSLLLISVYIILKAWEDRSRRLKVLGEDYLCDFNDYLRIF
jgi:hypothetical protein